MLKPEAWYGPFEPFPWRGHQVPVRRLDRAGAETVVLVHGFPTASWDWHAIWPALAAEHALITLDLIGFGWADKPRDHPYSLVDQADLVAAVIAAANPGPVHLLVHDYGVSIGQELLARATAGDGPAIRSCTFLNGGLFPAHHRPRPIQRILASPLGPLLVPLMGRRRFDRSFAAVFGPDTQPSPEELDACWTLLEHNDGRRVLPKLLGYMEERRRHGERWRNALVGSNAPLCLINGVLDPVSGGHLADAFEALLPTATVVRLADVGHYPQLEDPDAVSNAFLGFLAAVEAPS